MRGTLSVLAVMFIANAAWASEPIAGTSSGQLSQALADTVGAPEYLHPLNAPIEATPGQEFYFEVFTRKVRGYQLERPFSSSMAGSMGLPFAFSIDETKLVPIPPRRPGDWTYYEPANKKFSASHGLLGSVLATGDSVGLRINSEGRREWYVDNSNHNRGMNTMWTRRVKHKDPTAAEIELASREPTGSPLQKLIYLGMEEGRVRIRHEQIYPDQATTRDEYTFEIGADGQAVGAVRGAEFVIETGPLKSRITVRKPMTSSYGHPVATMR